MQECQVFIASTGTKGKGVNTTGQWLEPLCALGNGGGVGASCSGLVREDNRLLTSNIFIL